MPVTAKDSAVLAANLIISLSQILLELATEVLSDPEFAKSIKIVWSQLQDLVSHNGSYLPEKDIIGPN